MQSRAVFAAVCVALRSHVDFWILSRFALCARALRGEIFLDGIQDQREGNVTLCPIHAAGLEILLARFA